MGCDIHLFAERRNGTGWVSADNWTPDEYEEGRVSVAYGNRFYNGRNYDLFAILANVRNGRGFAGCDTGDGFVPICEPRGLPEDVTPEVAAESESWGADGHSHSHLTLAEILSYDWTQTTKKRGWINGVQLFEWSGYRRERGEGPQSYSGGVWGRDIQHVTAQELEARVEAFAKKADAEMGGRFSKPAREKLAQMLGDVYAAVEWTEPYYRAAGNGFWGETVPRLLRLGSPEDVRIVFWFDN